MNIYLELFGYIGTALVLLSMMMTSLVKLRWFNTAGSVVSMIYAALSNTWPVVFLNLGLIIINVTQLVRLKNTTVSFSHVPVALNDKGLEYFLQHYAQEIEKFFPGFAFDPREGMQAHMVFSGAEAVGVLIARKEQEDYHILLDFAAPKYRDCAVATFLFEKLKALGVSRLHVSEATAVHMDYLKKMGFREDDRGLSKTL